MKARICVLCLASVAMGFVLAGYPQSRTAGEEKAAPARAKWEYKSVTIQHDVKRLNELGQDGWELVSGAPTGDFNTGVSICFLKRPLQ